MFVADPQRVLLRLDRADYCERYCEQESNVSTSERVREGEGERHREGRERGVGLRTEVEGIFPDLVLLPVPHQMLPISPFSHFLIP